MSEYSCRSLKQDKAVNRSHVLIAVAVIAPAVISGLGLFAVQILVSIFGDRFYQEFNALLAALLLFKSLSRMLDKDRKIIRLK